MIRSRGVFAVVVLASVISVGASAQGAMLFSDNFDDNDLAGWTYSEYNANNTNWDSADTKLQSDIFTAGAAGDYVARLNANFAQGTPGEFRHGIYTIGAASIVEGVTYTLSVDVGHASGSRPYPDQVKVALKADAGAPTAVGGNETATLDVFDPGSDAWSGVGTVVYVGLAAHVGNPLYISLWANPQNGVFGNQVAFDDVTLEDDTVEAPIPEPATMALLGLGGLGTLIRRRRRK